MKIPDSPVLECPQVIEITSSAVQRCLADLANVHVLAESPLAQLHFVQARGAGRPQAAPLRWGYALHEVLLEAIDQLKPEKEAPNIQDPRWSAWLILNQRYVRKRGRNRYESIARELTISKSTYYRKLHEAIELLVGKLRDMDVEGESQSDANLLVGSKTLVVPPLPNHECFVGRRDLVQQIKTRLSSAETEQRTLGLWGLPGSGKTTLLVQLANDPEIRQLFPDGILWGSLGPNPNLVSLAHSWCRAMQVPSEALDDAITVTDKTRLLYQAIAHRRVLIVVDDVWDAIKALPLKVRGPGIGLLFTSRFPELAALLASNNILKVNELTLDGSLSVLKSYAPYAVENFSEQVHELATSMGGLPLALVIAGQFLQQASFAQQTRRIEQAFEELRNTIFRMTLSDSSVAANGMAPAQRTLQAVIAQSVDMLTPEAKQALGRLSLLPHKPHSFSETAALQITNATYEQLDELVDMGLLDVVLEQGSRYAIHQVIADYARSGVADPEAERAITHYFANWIQRPSEDGAAVRLELQNLLQAMQIARQRSFEMDSMYLALGLYPYLESWGYWSTAASLLNALLVNSLVRHSPQVHADVLLKISHSYFLQKQMIQAEAFAQSAEMLIQSGTDAAQSSRLHELQANILMARGEYRHAVSACTRAIEAAAEARSEDLEQQARHTMALAFSSMGEYDRLSTVLQQKSSPNIIVKSVTRAKLFQCQAQALAAVTLFLQAKLPEAEQKARSALDIARNTHNHRWIILSLEWLGWICNTQGKYAEVSCLMSEALSLVRDAEFKEDVTFLHCNLGLVSKARGAVEEAQGHLMSALTIANEVPIGRMNGKATLYSTLARIQIANDDLSAAEINASQSLEVADNKMEIIPSLALLGYIKARQGDSKASAAHFAEASSRAKRLGMLGTMFSLFATHYRGEAALCLGNFDAAATEFAAAIKLAERTHSPESLGVIALGMARAYAAVGHVGEARNFAEVGCTQLDAIGHCYGSTAHAVLDCLTRGERLSFDKAYGF